MSITIDHIGDYKLLLLSITVDGNHSNAYDQSIRICKVFRIVYPNWNLFDRFKQFPYINFQGNPSTWSKRVVSCRWTGVTWLIIAFRIFAHSPKTGNRGFSVH
jgi:hypothetical protein